MLRYLRENTGNWIIKIFLGIIVIVFIFLGVGSFGSKNENTVATINEEPITLKEFQDAYKAVVNQYRARFGQSLNEDLLKALNVKQQALDSLINQKLMKAEADRLNIHVSEKEIQDSLMRITAFQQDGLFSLDRYRSVLSREQLTPEVFEQMQAQTLRQEKLQAIILSTVAVSDQEVRTWYEFINTRMAVDYIEFSPETYTDVNPDEPQMKAWYDKNKDQYKSETKIKVRYLTFSPDDHKDAVSITDAQVRDYYDQHIAEFQTPEMVEASHILIRVAEDADEETVTAAEKKAMDIYESAEKGEDFASLARQHSEDASKENGGYLGRFDRKTMVQPFSDQAFSMKAGEISKPVRTVFGWHLIRVISRSDAVTRSLAEMSETIRQNLETQERMNLAYYKAGEAFDAVIDGDDLDQVANIVKKTVAQSGPFDINGEGLDMTGRADFARAAFAVEKDRISDVLQIGQAYYLIQVVEKIDPVVQAMDQVRDRVVADLKAELQRAKALEDARAFLAAAKEKKTLEQAGEASLEVQTTSLFTRKDRVEGPGEAPGFIEAAFSLTPDRKIYPELIETPGRFYVIAFKSQEPPDESNIAGNLADLKTQLIRQKENRFFESWLQALRTRASIEYDPQLMN